MPDQLERYHKIMDLYWFINGLKRNQTKANNRPTVMVHCYGHVGEIQVDIHPNGWDEEPTGDLISHKQYRKLVYKNYKSYHLDGECDVLFWEQCIADLEAILERCRDESDQSIQTEA